MTDDAGERYFESLWSWSESIANAQPTAARDYRIGDDEVRILFCDERIEQAIFRPFAHLLCESRNPALSVRAFDAASCQSPPPVPDWNANPVIQHSRILSLCTGAITLLYEQHLRTLSALDANSGRAVFVAMDAVGLPLWERAAPLRGLLSAWFASRGMVIAHAAALAVGDSAILLTGKGGSGKSTTALMAATAGMEYLGDDWCLLHAGQSAPARVSSLYSSAKLQWDSLHFVPALATAHDNERGSQDEKAIFYLHGRDGITLRTTAPLKAVLLPRVVSNARSSIRPATASDCWRALGPNSLAFVPGAGAAQFQLLAAIAKSLPAFHLDLGKDTREIPGLLREFLDQQDAHDQSA